ncbi:hypothetical protein N183_22415 [Sinorhizobium sp. Sb3]|nr:hypothetical protein N183_22415 [Sinorhizobium sp. Sb3]
MAPTQDGAAFYERCLRLIEDMDEAENLFRRSASDPTGRLRVDLPSRIGRLIVAPALPEFLTRYPGIDIDLGMTDRAVHLIEESVDCALRVGPLSDSGLIARPFGTLRLINVASPDYLERYGIPLVPSDLASHFAVNYASPSSGRVEDWEWIEGGEARTVAVPGRISVNSAEGSIACCLAGLGLIQIPAFDVVDHLKEGRLVEVMPGHSAAPMPMALLYPHRQHLSRRLQVFANWLEGLMREVITA